MATAGIAPGHLKQKLVVDSLPLLENINQLPVKATRNEMISKDEKILPTFFRENPQNLEVVVEKKAEGMVEPKLPASVKTLTQKTGSSWNTFRHQEEAYYINMYSRASFKVKKIDDNSEYSSSNEYKPPDSEVEESEDSSSGEMEEEIADPPSPISPIIQQPRKRRNPWSSDDDSEQRKMRRIEEPTVILSWTKELLKIQKPSSFPVQQPSSVPTGGPRSFPAVRKKTDDYKGITTDGHWWIAYRRINEKNICGGFYKTRREAAEKSDLLWHMFDGDEKYLNFPSLLPTYREPEIIAIKEVPDYVKAQEHSSTQSKSSGKQKCQLCGKLKPLRFAILPTGTEASICRKCTKSLQKRTYGVGIDEVPDRLDHQYEEIPLEKTQNAITPGEGKRNRRKIYCAHCEKTFFAKPTRRDSKYILNHCCRNPDRRPDLNFPTEKRKQYVLGKHHRKCRLHDESEPCLAFVDDWYYHGARKAVKTY